MNILFVKIRGNGYHCGCCRQEYTEVDEDFMEFENDAEVNAYIEDYNKRNNKEDIWISEAFEVTRQIL